MKSKSVKKLFIPSVYLVAVLSVVGCIYLTINTLGAYFKESDEFKYSINGVTEIPSKPVQPVQAEDVKEPNSGSNIIRPYNSDKVSIGRNFYDFEADSKKQENAIIFYENTYMQNTGVDYISDTEFNVISVLSGKVISVESDENLGNIIKIEHDKDIVTVYEGIDKITKKVGDIVNQGEVLWVSSKSIINSNFASSLHFEVYYKGEVIDPESFYTLNINDL